MPARPPDTLDSLRAENEALRAELKVSREAAAITAELVVSQFEATEHLLTRVQFAQAERDAIFYAASKVAIIATRLDGQITLFSRGAELLLGYRAAEAVGKMTLIAFLDPGEIADQGQRVSAETGREIKGWGLFVEAVQRGETDPREWTCVRKDSTPVPISLSVTGLRDTEGKITGYVGAAVDVSVTHRTEEELRRRQEALISAEKRQRDIINLLPDATLVVDVEGRVMFWNKAMERMTGVPASEIVGKGDYEYSRVFYGSRRPILIDLVLRPDIFAAGTYRQVEVQGDTMWAETTIENFRGSTVHLRGSASVLRDAKGQVVGAIETIFDITERKEMMQALRQAKEDAESSSNAKSIFLATMTHELRTPLNSIIGFSELISSESFGPIGDQQYLTYANYVHDGAKHLLDVINSILDLSKIEAGMMQLEHTQIQIGHLIRRCVRLVSELARQKGVAIRVAVPRNIVDLWGDERALRQIIINLLGNAIKFNSDKGTILITAIDAGDLVEIVVADTGIGIPAESIERVRKPFEQIHNQYNRSQGGTGLGLSIVEGLVKLHGGRLSISSEVGRGTAVTVHFPIYAPEGGER